MATGCREYGLLSARCRIGGTIQRSERGGPEGDQEEEGLLIANAVNEEGPERGGDGGGRVSHTRRHVFALESAVSVVVDAWIRFGGGVV